MASEGVRGILHSAAYRIYFPSSESWKNLEKLPPHPFHPFSCSSLAIKKHPGPLTENGMKGPVRSPAQFHLSGQCWPKRTPGITCPSSPSATFHQTEIGNSPRWHILRWYSVATAGTKSAQRHTRRKGLASRGSPA